MTAATREITVKQGADQFLSLLEEGCRALRKAKTLPEAKEVADKAEAIRVYARKVALSREMEETAAELKVRAERRMGELLRDMPKSNGDPRSHDVTRLSDVNIEKMQSHRCQRIASVPEEKFEEHIKDMREKKKPVTAAGVLRLAKTLTKGEPPPFSFLTESDAIFKWLKARRESWPPELRDRFVQTVRAQLRNIEAQVEGKTAKEAQA